MIIKIRLYKKVVLLIFTILFISFIVLNVSCRNKPQPSAISESVVENNVSITKKSLSIEKNNTENTQKQLEILYTNNEYGFSFSLPTSWDGYSIITTEWEGNPAGSVIVIEKGPIISIRNPKWTSEIPYQDIPIMVFTTEQWDSLLQEEFHIGAAPIGPSELGHNLKYVFALPARYNYSYPAGVEEVEKILEGNPLKVF